jgi:lysophospholipid acyltransferase
MLEQRTQKTGARLTRTTSTESLSTNSHEPVLGVSDDPGKDIDEAIKEIQGEVEKARKDLNKRRPLKKEL